MNTSSFKKILLFALPSILMQMFMALYTIIDGMFIANFVGEIEVGCVNIILPFLTLEMGIGIMFGTGGAAYISKLRGQKRNVEAQQYTTLLICVLVVIGLVFSLIGGIFTEDIARLLGATDIQVPHTVSYGRLLCICCPIVMLQSFFLNFFIVAEKPNIGLVVTIIGGVMNIVLDYVFLKVCNMGIIGASIATVIGWSIPVVTGLIYFTSPHCKVKLLKPRYSAKVIAKSLLNGMSEMVANLAYAVTTFLYNIMFLKYFNELGTSAICIALYIQYLFSAIFYGYAMGVSSIIAYKYGEKDHEGNKKIVIKSLIFIAITSAVLFIISNLLISPLTEIFVSPDSQVYQIVVDGFFLFSISFLFMGISIFTSTLFTSLQNGIVSGIISFCRTLLFISTSIIILPSFFNTDGLWFAISFAELLGIIMASIFLICYKKRYKY